MCVPLGMILHFNVTVMYNNVLLHVYTSMYQALPILFSMGAYVHTGLGLGFPIVFEHVFQLSISPHTFSIKYNRKIIPP